MLTCSKMDVKLFYLFVCVLQTSWCLEPNNKKTHENRPPRAKFPFFGNIFGSTTTTTTKPTTYVGAGLLNYFFGASEIKPTLPHGKNNTVIYTIQDQSSGYLDPMVDIQSSGDSVIYTVQNGSKTNLPQFGNGNGSSIYTIYNQSGTGSNLNQLKDIYLSDGSVTYTVQNETGHNVYQSGSGSGNKVLTNTGNGSIYTIQGGAGSQMKYNQSQTGSDYKIKTVLTNNGDGSTIYTINNQSGTSSNLNQLKDIYLSDGSVIYTVQNETGNNFYQSESDKGNKILTNNGNGSIYTIQSGIGSQMKDTQSGTGSDNKKTTVLTNNRDGSTMYMINNQSGTGSNLGQLNDIYSSGGSVIYTVQNETGNNFYHTGSGSGNKETTVNNGNGSKYTIQSGFSSLPIQNTNSLATNIFLTGGQESKPYYLNEDKFTLVEEQVVPNALASTNGLQGNANSNKVIVICTDPITGSVVAKYESSNILQEKEGSTEWESIGDNSSSISLPSQLIVRNMSMTIRGRVHYCQIINVADGSLVQGNNGQSILVDVNYNDGAVVGNTDLQGTNNTGGQEHISHIVITSNDAKQPEVSSASPMYVTTELSVETQSRNNSSVLFVSENSEKGGNTKLKEQDKNNKSKDNLFISQNNNKKDSDVRIKEKDVEKHNSDESLFISHHGTVNEESSLKNKHKLKDSHKVSSQELHISSFLANRNDGNIYYSEKPHISTHGEVPFFSMHVYHHSVEEDSNPVDSLEGVFISKPVKLMDDDKDDDSDDDISSDFEKFNAAAKYAVFRFD